VYHYLFRVMMTLAQDQFFPEIFAVMPHDIITREQKQEDKNGDNDIVMAFYNPYRYSPDEMNHSLLLKRMWIVTDYWNQDL